jgi:hypothetical protein
VFVVSVLLIAFASCIALVNIIGGYGALRRARHGIPGGYSCVPLFSVLFSTVAWLFSQNTIGIWAFVPAVIDPATWSLAYLPFYLSWRWYHART